MIPDAVKLVDYQRPRDRNIDLTPLLDVVFQLLIFFMVSAQFTAPKAKIDLPLGSGGAEPDKASTVLVEVTASGEIRVDHERVAEADFKAALTAAMDRLGAKKVRFHGDRGLDYGVFVTLMDSAQELGAEGIEIVKDRLPAPEE